VDKVGKLLAQAEGTTTSTRPRPSSSGPSSWPTRTPVDLELARSRQAAAAAVVEPLVQERVDVGARGKRGNRHRCCSTPRSPARTT
jgi:hypothetical protein